MAEAKTEDAISNACEALLSNVKQLCSDLGDAKATKKDKDTLNTIDGILKANERDIGNIIDEVRADDKDNTLPIKCTNRQSIDRIIKNKLFLKYAQIM